MNNSWTIYESPCGPLTLVGGELGLRAVHFPGHGGRFPETLHDPGSFAAALAQLEEYFSGRRRRFELALVLGGTPFQRLVWAQLSAIPFGETRSYATIARATGRVDRVRAVGAAVGRTPVPIIVPCHRVVGSNGDLTGYRGGLQRKRALLELEAAVSRGGPLPDGGSDRQLSLTG